MKSKNKDCDREPFTEKLLYFLADVADYGYRVRSLYGVLHSDDPKFAPQRMWLNKVIDSKEGKQKLHKAFYSLKRSGCIQEKMFEKKKGLVITEKGRLKTVRNVYRNNKLKKLPKGNYIIVFFDVPEEMKKRRDFFRGAIKELGFEKLQLSVWASSYDVKSELNSLIEKCGLEDCTKALVVQEMD